MNLVEVDHDLQEALEAGAEAALLSEIKGVKLELTGERDGVAWPGWYGSTPVLLGGTSLVGVATPAGTDRVV